RVDHGYASIDVKDENEYYVNTPEGFIKDSSRWVIFPRLSFANHAKIEARNEALRSDADWNGRNLVLAEGPAAADAPKRGVAAGGISFAYANEELAARGTDGALPARLMKVSTPFPFPEAIALDFLKDLDEVLVLEEMDPVIERELTYNCGKHGLTTNICGKHSHHIAASGENTRDSVGAALDEFLGTGLPGAKAVERPEPPQLPVRPPVLCAGCPHRASFYAVKQAMKGQKAFFAGDIGCYTLGNAMPLDMCDTCLCMGAGVNIAQGIWRTEPDTTSFAFVGDSTFFASAITGVVNAVYNQANMTLVILDNSTTAMTGHQPHPGTGRTMMGEVVEKIDPVKVLEGIGVTEVVCLDPMDLSTAVPEVQRVSALPGVKAIIFQYPCIALFKPTKYCEVDQAECIDCRRCIRELGCPALFIKDGHVEIDSGTCTGCGLCSQVCPKNCIGGVER
ncbi:MAG: thiamine pyrophosphate-dependent enzyme, partial [Eubacteriales bacterium]|nr:thiamine pyrophosphate-dependent enzyme [Eubacteriales bacterium]